MIGVRRIPVVVNTQNTPHGNLEFADILKKFDEYKKMKEQLEQKQKEAKDIYAANKVALDKYNQAMTILGKPVKAQITGLKILEGGYHLLPQYQGKYINPNKEVKRLLFRINNRLEEKMEDIKQKISQADSDIAVIKQDTQEMEQSSNPLARMGPMTITMPAFNPGLPPMPVGINVPPSPNLPAQKTDYLAWLKYAKEIISDNNIGGWNNATFLTTNSAIPNAKAVFLSKINTTLNRISPHAIKFLIDTKDPVSDNPLIMAFQHENNYEALKQALNTPGNSFTLIGGFQGWMDSEDSPISDELGDGSDPYYHKYMKYKRKFHNVKNRSN